MSKQSKKAAKRRRQAEKRNRDLDMLVTDFVTKVDDLVIYHGPEFARLLDQALIDFAAQNQINLK